MADEQFYQEMLYVLSLGLPPALRGTSHRRTIEDGLKIVREHCQKIIDDCQAIISSDKDRSWQKIYSQPSLEAFERSYFPHIVIDIIDFLEGKDFYSTEALEGIAQLVGYSKERRSLRNKKSPHASDAKESLLTIIRMYLEENAPDHESRMRAIDILGSGPAPDYY